MLGWTFLAARAIGIRRLPDIGQAQIKGAEGSILNFSSSAGAKVASIEPHKPGDIVVFDSLSNHTVEGVREAIEAAGADFRPLWPYSPDLDTIEWMFAKPKALLRKAAGRGRSRANSRAWWSPADKPPHSNQ